MTREQDPLSGHKSKDATDSRAAKRTQKRILVVDDDPSVREMLARVLADEGYAVMSAADGQEALETAVAAPVDLVLLDLNMPGRSGWDTFEGLTGCAVVVNTSFNVRGEPIVCTPADAYQCFMRTHIDVLVLGSFFLQKQTQPTWKESVQWQKEFQLD